jgi:hypothetical protein
MTRSQPLWKDTVQVSTAKDRALFGAFAGVIGVSMFVGAWLLIQHWWEPRVFSFIDSYGSFSQGVYSAFGLLMMLVAGATFSLFGLTYIGLGTLDAIKLKSASRSGGSM